MHESLECEHEIKGGSDRSFGIVFAVVFGIIACWPLFHHQQPRVWALITAVVFAAVALSAPQLLAPLNRLWLRFGLLLSRVMNPIIMGVMYCLIFVPIGIGMRLFGRDFLRLKLEPEVASYWIVREPPGPAPESIKNPF